MNLSVADKEILRNKLVGSNLKNLLKKKGLKKYTVAKGCGLTYQTLLNWEKGRFKPSDDCVLIVARYLGLIEPDEADKLQLQKDIDEINKKFKRLGKESI